MKNGILIFISGIIGVLVMAIVMTIGGNQSRSIELQENLSGAAENAVWDTTTGKATMDADGMITEAVAQMVIALDSDMGTAFRVYQTDADKGLLAVGAAGDYQHPNGTQGDVSWERMVIYERGDEEEVNSCEVRFYKDKEALLTQADCYKRVTVISGLRVKKPSEPKKDGLVFAGWRDSNDYIADFSQAVTGDISYYAAWE